MLVGHASDDIRETASFEFTTKKVLPFVVTGATTLGELMSDPRTAPVAGEILSKMAQQGFSAEAAESSGESVMGTDKEMMQAMMAAMPLKSLVSFAGGALDGDALIAAFNQSLGN